MLSVDAHHLDGTGQPGQRAADQHGADGGPVAADAAKQGEAAGLSGHALFVAVLGAPEVDVDRDHGDHRDHKTHAPLGARQEGHQLRRFIDHRRVGGGASIAAHGELHQVFNDQHSNGIQHDGGQQFVDPDLDLQNARDPAVSGTDQHGRPVSARGCG